MAKDYEQEALDKFLARKGSTEYVEKSRAEGVEYPYAAYAGYMSCVLRNAEWGFKQAMKRAHNAERELLALQFALEYHMPDVAGRLVADEHYETAYEAAEVYEKAMKDGVSEDKLRISLNEDLTAPWGTVVG